MAVIGAAAVSGAVCDTSAMGLSVDFLASFDAPYGLISPRMKLFSSACRKRFSSMEKLVSMIPVSGDDSVLAMIGLKDSFCVGGVSFDMFAFWSWLIIGFF